jgi:hypothetical protein
MSQPGAEATPVALYHGKIIIIMFVQVVKVFTGANKCFRVHNMFSESE